MPDRRQFAELLSHVAREITRRQTAEVCCGELTLEQFQTLRLVRRSAPASIGSLSAEQRVDLSTMSRNVDRLERGGYLLRARSEDDARVVQVRLTPKGSRALDTLSCSERDVLSDVYDRLPPAERPRLVAALGTLRACLDAPAAAGGEACCAPAPRRRARP